LDKEAGQFWVSKPWEIVAEEHNLSAFERNATYLNVGEGRFVDLTFVSGAGNDGDGRSVIALDVDNDGMQDLVVRQAGGEPLLLLRNRMPKRHWLRIALKGTESNAQGLGARITATIGGRTLVRELYPINTYFSQAPAEAHFGLGDATVVDRIDIRWPSGKTQSLTNVPVGRRMSVTEP
jgi:hypothetical protein